MQIGTQLRYFRELRGMTRQDLGLAIGCPENIADICIRQYEKNQRKPKKKALNALAEQLSIRPEALTVPEFETHTELAHALFLLEDNYGLRAAKIDNTLCLRLNSTHTEDANFLCNFLDDWLKQREAVRSDQLTTDDYDHWRYNYHSDLTALDNTNAQKTAQDLLLSELGDMFREYLEQHPHLNPDLTVGQRIKILRKQHKLSQRSLAEQIGVTELTIRKYEVGKFLPKIATLISLAKVFNVDIVELDPSLMELKHHASL